MVRSKLLMLLLLSALPVWAEETETEAAAESDELTFDDLFLRAAVRHTALSPSGEYVAYFHNYQLMIGNPGAGYFEIRGFHSRLSIQDIEWIGSETVWVNSWDPRNTRYIGTAVRFADNGDGEISLDRVQDHFDPGYISDNLFDDKNRVVLARPRFEDDVAAADLYVVNVFAPVEKQLTKSNRIDTGSEDFFYYQKNSAGDYVLGIKITEGVPEIWRKLPSAEEWEHVWTADKESTFLPWRMSDDARTLWVLTDAQTDRVVASEFDLESRAFGEILYQHDRVDVDGILMSRDDGTPIGVVYTEEGFLRYEFFTDQYEAEFEQLRAHFPGQGVVVTGYAQYSDVRLIFASSPTHRGAIHVCDLAVDKCDLIENIAPWLEGKPLSPSVALRVPSSDGITVDAFLTLPLNRDGKIPMIAMPHGGPIGVSDDRYFSSEVQWLAHNGYAVLQVNYRGSSGYGEEFQNAGLRQWGRGIEDDIEAAVRMAVSEHPEIDVDRLGIFGASYGGYSAMMSVIRNPDLFKCAASFAGVMDLTLLFTQSTIMRNEHMRDKLIEYVGDPDVDYEEQFNNSPVYRYKEITRPILLSHGVDDTVVDFEHSWRLRKMLMLDGAEPEFILLKDIGHGFSYVDDARKLHEPLLAFLDQHLKPTAATTE